MKNLAIIQARMGSSRLPNKVLLKLGDSTVLEQVINRVRSSKQIDKIIVATTVAAEDDEIFELCNKNNITVFRGSENDVLDRYYQSAKLFSPENVIRITADCPLIDAAVIDKIITEHLRNNNDYTSNVIDPTYPDGEDVEIMRYDVLKEAWERAVLASQREHVTQYIIHNDKFKKGNVYNTENLEGMRWTLDTLSDYSFISKVYDELFSKNPNFGLSEILDLLKRRPDLGKINCENDRNEGLKKSLANDYSVK